MTITIGKVLSHLKDYQRSPKLDTGQLSFETMQFVIKHSEIVGIFSFLNLSKNEFLFLSILSKHLYAKVQKRHLTLKMVNNNLP